MVGIALLRRSVGGKVEVGKNKAEEQEPKVEASDTVEELPKLAVDLEKSLAGLVGGIIAPVERVGEVMLLHHTAGVA